MQTKQNNDSIPASNSRYAREIKAGACTIRVLTETTFEIDDNPEGENDPSYSYGPYYVPDTRDLDSIVAVVSNLKWTEDQLFAAIDDLTEGRTLNQIRLDALEPFNQ